MSKERIKYLDRMISKLRLEQEDLMQEHSNIEEVICKYEKEADKLEVLLNEETYGRKP